MAVGALEPRFYAEFARVLGLPEETPDQFDLARWDELREAVTARFASRTREEWTELFSRHRRLRRPRPLPRRGRESPAPRRPGDLHHPRGPRPARPGPRFSATPTAVRTGPALPGADTAEVARDWGLGPR